MGSKIVYASQLLEELYPAEAKELKEVYPDFYRTATQTRVINWQERWEAGDVNPEIIEKIKELDEKFDKGEITEKEYNRELSSDELKKYSSRVEGISFIKEKLVAFRDYPPSLATLIHEIGHVHYGVGDEIWNASQGGTEALFWLGLKGKYRVSEENVKKYIEMVDKVRKDETYLDAVKEIVEKLYPLLKDQIAKAFYPIVIFAGVMPNGLNEKFGTKVMHYKLNNPIWASITPLREDVWLFLVDLIVGLKYDDPFCQTYSRELGFIGG